MAPDRQTDSNQTNSRWGTLGTTVWTLILATVFVIVQALVFILSLQSESPGTPLSEIELTGSESNGWLFALATIGTTLVVLPLLLVVIKLKRGSSLQDYLALQRVPLKTIAQWVCAALFLVLASDALKWTLGIPIAIDFVVDTYSTMGNVAVFLRAIAILAPLTEELLCRGFMLSGLQRCFLGSTGAVVVTALLWAIIHFQYDVYDITVIFLMGCLLGASRIITGSIYPAIAAHMANNFLSYLLIGLYIENYSN